MINPFNNWFYFRMGYSFYFAPLLSGSNALMLLYFVVGEKVFFIRDVFPHFLIFIAVAVMIGLPFFMLVGYIHYKRKAFKSEQEVLTTNNPYHFKLPDGFTRDVVFPIHLEMIDYLIENGNGDKEKVRRLKELRNKVCYLIEGGNIAKY